MREKAVVQEATEFSIRTDWMFDVRSACQTFQCEAWMADRFKFEQALHRLRASIAPAVSAQEGEALRELLLIGVTEAARMFHRTYHMMRPRRRCSSSPVEEAHDVWSLGSDDPHKALVCWSQQFLRTFDASHPISPAERAAASLRERFIDPPNLDELAMRVGSSRSNLTRVFERFYGVSCGEFVTRLRLRSFIEALRTPGASAGQLALDVGYGKYHNALDALRLRTGFKPSDIRCLRDNDLRELMDVKLAVSLCLGKERRPPRSAERSATIPRTSLEFGVQSSRSDVARSAKRVARKRPAHRTGATRQSPGTGG